VSLRAQCRFQLLATGFSRAADKPAAAQSLSGQVSDRFWSVRKTSRGGVALVTAAALERPLLLQQFHHRLAKTKSNVHVGLRVAAVVTVGSASHAEWVTVDHTHVSLEICVLKQ